MQVYACKRHIVSLRRFFQTCTQKSVLISDLQLETNDDLKMIEEEDNTTEFELLGKY